MEIRLRYFAALRESIGKQEERIELPEGSTIAQLRAHLLTIYPRLEESLSRVVVAHNRQYSVPETVLRDQDEVVFIPPLGGGAQDFGPDYAMEPVIIFTNEPLEREKLVAQIAHPAVGGIVVFEGVVRNHARGKNVRYLEYEIFEEMARLQVKTIIEEARQRWSIERVAVAHRWGHLEIGEASILIVVGTPHRAEAFEASRFLIDELKKRVPIWKKEVATDGETWVEG